MGQYQNFDKNTNIKYVFTLSQRNTVYSSKVCVCKKLEKLKSLHIVHLAYV